MENKKDINTLIIGRQTIDDKSYKIPLEKLNNRLMIVDENQEVVLNYIKQIINKNKNIFFVVKNEFRKKICNTVENKNIKMYKKELCFKLNPTVTNLIGLLMSFIEEKEIKNVEQFINDHVNAFKINECIEVTQKTIDKFIHNIEIESKKEEEEEIKKIIINALNDLKERLTKDYIKELDIFEDIKNRKSIICISENDQISLFYYVLSGLASSKEIDDVNKEIKDDYFVFLPIFSDNNYIDKSMSVYLAQSRSLRKSIIIYTDKYDRKKVYLNANFNSLLLKISDNNYIFIDEDNPSTHLKIYVI